MRSLSMSLSYSFSEDIAAAPLISPIETLGQGLAVVLSHIALEVLHGRSCLLLLCKGSLAAILLIIT